MKKINSITLLAALVALFSCLSLCSAFYTAPMSDYDPCPPLPANGLVNQWLFNGTFKDTASCQTIQIVEQGSMGIDVFFQGSQYGWPGNSVRVSPLFANGINHYNTYKAPDGTYFNGDFTATVSVRLFSCDNWARVIDFGNGQQNDNVVLVVSEGTSCKPFLISVSGTTWSSVSSLQPLTPGIWYDLAYVIKGNTGYIYVDGVRTGSGPILSPRNVVRKSNYFTKSNWASDGHFNGHVSNLSIYKRALDPSEISTFPVGYGLVNFWPFNCYYPQNLRDDYRKDLMSRDTMLTTEIIHVGGAQDRKGYDGAWAANFNDGYIRAPTSTYFYGGDFTICAWVQVIKHNKYHRLVDFSTGGNDNNRVFAALSGSSTDGYDGKPTLGVLNDGKWSQALVSSSVALTIGKWQFVAFTLKGNLGSVFIDGVLTGQGYISAPRNVVRDSNFIGRSQSSNDQYLYANIDDLRIFRRAVPASEQMTLSTYRFYGW